MNTSKIYAKRMVFHANLVIYAYHLVWPSQMAITPSQQNCGGLIMPNVTKTGPCISRSAGRATFTPQRRFALRLLTEVITTWETDKDFNNWEKNYEVHLNFNEEFHKNVRSLLNLFAQSRSISHIKKLSWLNAIMSFLTDSIFHII